MQQQKGFTIIELIVVIAIIAVLATIVTTNVMVYINKGKNAAIKGNMANLSTYGITYYTNHSDSYDGFCTDTTGKVGQFLTAINNSATPQTAICNCDTTNCINANAWCVVVQTKDSIIFSERVYPKKYCIDSTGKKQESVNTSFTCTDGVCVGG